ncbi:MAG TPA: Hsp20 family protein [Methanosarcina sp.]|nr:Hsp20 family protein [Methanosarcina sp.]
MTNLSLRTHDLAALTNLIHRNGIGFETVFDQFINSKVDAYPPHNIIQTDESRYVIELAVAGFEENEITVELQEQVLTVTGEQFRNESANNIYHHKGISARNFVRTFRLAEHIQVAGASLKNGILAITLDRVIPEESKPKRIAITFGK